MVAAAIILFIHVQQYQINRAIRSIPKGTSFAKRLHDLHYSMGVMVLFLREMEKKSKKENEDSVG